MATKIYLSQRTERHVVKRLDASYTYESHFGTYGTLQTDNTGTNFPWAIANDTSDNIYVCDGNNKRIIKLDSGLGYIGNVDVSNEIGIPQAIFYDSTTGDLFIVGVYDYRFISIARITTALSIVKYDNNVYPTNSNSNVLSISRASGVSDFLISGMDDLLIVDENGQFIIDSTNNTIDFEEVVGFEFTAVISSGTYTPTALATEIQSQLNLVEIEFLLLKQ